jgi:DNA repair exonuclease SbcCD ATPase subunit
VEITPDPDNGLVVIAGRNAQGKSSVLDAIWATLAGKGGAVQRPIRDGERRAHVTLDLGDLTVTRKWSGARTELVVSANGARYASPQKMLDDLIGRLSFDPVAFATMDAAKQRATLIEVAGADLADTLDEIAEERKVNYDGRTESNRDLKRIKAQLDGLPNVPADTPDEEVDIVHLAGLVQAHTQVAERRATLLAEYSRLVEEKKRIEIRLAEIVSEGSDLKRQVAEVDLDALNERLQNADETNKAVRIKRQRTALAAEYATYDNFARRATDRIAELDAKREAALEAASFPIDGLSFDDEGVLYNGVPFAQASAAERLRVSVAMAMAMNPEVRVIRITDGSLLDSENLALIESMATEHDFQIWIERVDESGEVGIVIEDGEVKA